MHHLYLHEEWVLGILRQRWFTAIDRRKQQDRQTARRKRLDYGVHKWDSERGCFVYPPNYAVLERITEGAYDGYMDMIERTWEHRFTVYLEDA
jgi:hypothetical protein